MTARRRILDREERIAELEARERRGSSRSPKPLFSLDKIARYETALRFVGQIVELEIDALRDGRPIVVEGELLAVAVPHVGTVAELVVLKPDRPGDLSRAFSLATIRSIRNPRRASA